jgi:hypothetical protein
MLLGSIVMSTWGGPKRRVKGVVGFIALAAVGDLLMGLRPSAIVIGAGFFLLLFCIPLAAGASQAIFQTKVAPEVQGRVFATRSMISSSIMPLAHLLSGPLADGVFEPLMHTAGPLGQSWIGRALGTGPGRGIGLLFVLSGTLLLVASAAAWSNPHIRHVEDDLPDAVPEMPAEPEPDVEPQPSPA